MDWKTVQNEGGDGWEPKTEVASTEPRWSRLESRKAKLLRVMTGTATADPRYAQLQAELSAVSAQLAKEEK